MEKLRCFLAKYAKAIGAFVGSLATGVVAHYALDVPELYLVAVPSVVTTALVYFLTNKDCEEPAP
jgi:CBS-domain-containing membrane protein